MENKKGILNYVSVSSDFDLEYIEMDYFKMFSKEKVDGSLGVGFFAYFNESEEIKEDMIIYIPASLKSYLNIKNIFDEQTRKVEDSYSFFNIITGFYDIDVLAGIVRDVDQTDYFESYIILEKENRFLSVNVPLSNIFGMSSFKSFPIYFNKDVFDLRSVPEKILEDVGREDFIGLSRK